MFYGNYIDSTKKEIIVMYMKSPGGKTVIRD